MASLVTTEEIRQFAEMNRRGMCLTDICAETGRCEKTVRHYLRSVGVDPARNKHSVRKDAWTFSDMRMLLTMYRDGVPLKEIAQRIGRSFRAVATKLSNKVKATRNVRVSKERIQYIAENYRYKTSRQIGEELGVSASTVRNHLSALGLAYKTKKWSWWMYQYLRDNYADGDNKDISAHLGVTVAAIHKKAWKLGLKKSDAYMASMQKERAKTLNEVRELAHQALREKYASKPKKVRKKKQVPAKNMNTFMQIVSGRVS